MSPDSLAEKNLLLEIGHLIATHRTFLVAGHIRPDGDSTGSQLALGLALINLGKKVDVWNSDGLTPSLSFLPGSHLLTKPPEASREFDVVIAVDTAIYDRLGVIKDRIASRKILIDIDHHATNPRYGDVNWIDPTSSASGEMVYRLLVANKFAITPDIAANLLVAISTDTGSYQYSNTTPNALRVSAELIDAGADIGELSRECYYNYPVARFRLLSAILLQLEFAANGRIGSFWLTPKMYEEAGATRQDGEGLIDYVRAIDSVVVAVLFEQLDSDRVKISLRSKSDTLRVDSIAQIFGGGGHKAAAAATLTGSRDNVQHRVLDSVRAALEIAS